MAAAAAAVGVDVGTEAGARRGWAAGCCGCRIVLSPGVVWAVCRPAVRELVARGAAVIVCHTPAGIGVTGCALTLELAAYFGADFFQLHGAFTADVTTRSTAADTSASHGG